MPWLDGLKGIAEIAEMRSFNWIAQEAKTKPANGKKLETCKILDMGTCLLHYQNLMISVKCSDQIKTLLSCSLLFKDFIKSIFDHRIAFLFRPLLWWKSTHGIVVRKRGLEMRRAESVVQKKGRGNLTVLHVQ